MCSAPPSSPVSRVVYNGKRNSSPRSPPSSSEIFTPAHEENVRFIYEGTWGSPSQGWGAEKSSEPPAPSQSLGSCLARSSEAMSGRVAGRVVVCGSQGRRQWCGPGGLQEREPLWETGTWGALGGPSRVEASGWVRVPTCARRGLGEAPEPRMESTGSRVSASPPAARPGRGGESSPGGRSREVGGWGAGEEEGP